MTRLFDDLFGSALILAWLAGTVLAKGVGATIAAIVIPFYAWYLVLERLMQMGGML